MATGISRREQLSSDALTAALPHRDPHPLPTEYAKPVLSYAGRISETQILTPLSSSFVSVSTSGSFSPADVKPNGIVLADNLFALHSMLASGQKATLIYLDPPYNTGMHFQSRELQHAYPDEWSEAAYIEYMRRRLILMRELLTDEGSIYVQIGHQMIGHLKVIMDEIFGPLNFRNLITRRKCSSKNFTKKQYANINDYVLFYTKSAKYKWNQPGEKPLPEWIEKEYPKSDARGLFKLVPVHAPGTRNGETGKPWRGVLPPPGKHWQYTPAKLDEMDKAGEIHWSRSGNPRRKVYLSDDKLVPYTDYWENFRDAHHQSVVITGYPTEKNLAMLRMIVSASSDPGDIVLDPFCGSGTTMQAAQELSRNWVGIDQSFYAVQASIKRFRYGLQKMGDYVARRGSEADIDLFSTGSSLPPPKHVRNHTESDTVEYSILVDEELLSDFDQEVRVLAAL